MPEHALTLAPAYGYLLLLQGGDYYAALGLLQRALEFGPNPDAAALVALALLRLERAADAQERLQTVLSEYCAVPGVTPFQAAGEIALHPAVGAPGWVGRGPGLELLGELARQESTNVLDIRIDGRTSFSQLLRRGTDGARRQRFSVPAPAASHDRPLEIRIHGVPLAGSPLSVPADFGFDGRVTTRGARLSGWARLGWLPAARVRLRLEDETGRRAHLQTDPPAIPGQGLPFLGKLRAAGLRGSIIGISRRGCRWSSAACSPTPRCSPNGRSFGRRARLRASRPGSGAPVRARTGLIEGAPLTDVIIPVYRGREETLACISSVLATIGEDARVIVVDDATDDAALAAALDRLHVAGRITLLRNRVNQGFVASVNRGMSVHTAHDVVLLNSDTLVFDDWLTRLRVTAI